ncbi:hypothetical protein Tco_1075035, partial [Tanacetum coccineum]
RGGFNREMGVGLGLDWVKGGLGKRMGWYLVMVKVLRELAGKERINSFDKSRLTPLALTALKSAKPKADKVMLQEPEQGIITTTTTATTVTAASTRPKAKGLVIHE